jgi:hypothetical protein
LTDDTYTIDAPIVIEVTQSTDGPVGIDLGGAKILSQITDGSPVIEIVVSPGVDLDHAIAVRFFDPRQWRRRRRHQDRG